MADTLDGAGDGLRVHDPRVLEIHGQPEALAQDLDERLDLDLAHHTDVDLPARGIPFHAQQRVLVVQDAQRLEDSLLLLAVLSLRGADRPVQQDGSQTGAGAIRLGPQPLSRPGARQSRDRADASRGDGRDRLEPPPVIDAQFVRLLGLPLPRAQRNDGDFLLGMQRPACHTQPCQPLAPSGMGDTEDLRAELPSHPTHRSEGPEDIQKTVGAAQVKRGAEEARDKPAPRDQRADLQSIKCSRCQIALEHRVVERRDTLGALTGNREPRPGDRERRTLCRVAEIHAPLGQGRKRAQDPAAVESGHVGLVDEDEDRDGQVPQHPPEQTRGPLHAVRGRDDEDRAVQDREGPLRLRREVGVTRRVQKRQVHAPVADMRLMGEDRDAAGFLDRAGVQEGGPVVHASGGADLPAPVQQSFRQRGLSGVDMCDDSRHDTP